MGGARAEWTSPSKSNPTCWEGTPSWTPPTAPQGWGQETFLIQLWGHLSQGAEVLHHSQRRHLLSSGTLAVDTMAGAPQTAVPT